MTHAPNLSTADRRYHPRHSVRSPCWFRCNGEISTGTLSAISATGAFVDCARRPDLGAYVRLLHHTGGEIGATVIRHGTHGFGLMFALGEESVTFALRAITGAMTTEMESA